MASFRNSVFEYIRNQYKVKPEYLWVRFPDYAVFRHEDNRKWFAVLMNIPYEKIDSGKSGRADILNVKLDDLLLRDLLIREKGYYSGYHMSRGSWISVVLDGTVPFDSAARLIDVSFAVTASGKKKQEMRQPKEWLIPSNPKYYDIIHAFDETDTIDWKQGRGIRKDDTVFLYVGSPVSAVLYQCRVLETDIPYHFRTDGLTITSLMKIKLQKRFQPEQFPFECLKTEFGIFAVRGPRGVPNSLSAALNDKKQETEQPES
ncbi:MAG: MmcQ/YjbR family DNA-binding protein [Oscillospiraceae bacterium]|nr:MmcQ/YjbR family DNA-binding protein [Oscillospiraceae bacterium]